MTKLEALQKSVAKWEAIVDGTGVDRGARDCALCDKYNKDLDRPQCVGCPVMEASCARLCTNTPYEDWGYHQIAYHLPAKAPVPARKIECSECLRLAEDELAFLKGLLEKEQASHEHTQEAS